jgi:hypothetical protein
LHIQPCPYNQSCRRGSLTAAVRTMRSGAVFGYCWELWRCFMVSLEPTSITPNDHQLFLDWIRMLRNGPPRLVVAPGWSRVYAQSMPNSGVVVKLEAVVILNERERHDIHRLFHKVDAGFSSCLAGTLLKSQRTLVRRSPHAYLPRKVDRSTTRLPPWPNINMAACSPLDAKQRVDNVCYVGLSSRM